jgi:hypothetical protein
LENRPFPSLPVCFFLCKKGLKQERLLRWRKLQIEQLRQWFPIFWCRIRFSSLPSHQSQTWLPLAQILNNGSVVSE